MPSQPCSASWCQNESVTASCVAMPSRTNFVVHSASRKRRAVSRSNSCSSLKPMSIALSGGISDRHRALDDAAVHDAAIFAGIVVEDEPVQQAAVVPHDEIAFPPAVAVDEARLR